MARLTETDLSGEIPDSSFNVLPVTDMSLSREGLGTEYIEYMASPGAMYHLSHIND